MSARDAIWYKDIFTIINSWKYLVFVFVAAFLFRTVDEKNKEEKDDSLSSLTTSDTISNTLANTGVNLNYHKEPALTKCKENEIYLMNKQKMFLVSSEKIVHDISGSVGGM